MGEVEEGFDGAGGAASADEGAVGSLAEDEGKGADEDGFSGAGFTGDDIEAGLEVEGEVGDKGEVFNAEGREHARVF